MSTSAVLIKSSHAPGIVTAFYRMGIGAAVLLLPFLLHSILNTPPLPLKGIMMAVCAGLCFGLDLSFWSTGVVASNATIPTISANMAPIWVGLGSMFIFNEKHKPGFWMGLLLALFGLSLLIYNDISLPNNIVKGALLGMVAGIFYGGFYLFAQAGRKLLDTLCFLFISTFISAIVLCLVALLHNYEFAGYDRHTWLIFIAIGIGVQVIGWFLLNYSQGHLSASIVSPTLLGQPVITAILAATLIDEQLTWLHITGGIVVITGIYIVHFSRKK